MTVHWFRPPEADAEMPVRSRLHGLMLGGAPSDGVLLDFPGAACTDGETAPAWQPARRSPEPDLLFWFTHIPAGVLATALLFLTAFGCFALAIITISGAPQ